MTFPPIARVRQTFHQPTVADVPGAVIRAVLESRIAARVRPGGSIAVTVGSRGIAGIDRIAKATVDALRSLDFAPFLVAAMGSHGGGTADGQRAMLAEFGITESAIGCPIRSEMDTVVLGTNAFGLPIHFDANAARADGIVLLNRIKPHTSFTGRYESGLLKMLTIGLGKRQGAAQVHKLGLPGLKRMLPEVGAFLLEKTPVALGLAILENAEERMAKIVAVEPEEILEAEPRLLDEARDLMGRLPFDQIDVLIVGELGKNYSGTGLDPNVIGRQRVETMPDLPRPVVTRLVVLDVSAETRGNALGIGLADLTTERLTRAIDPTPMRVNSFTSNFLTRARVPLALPTDRDAIAASLDTCWRTEWSEARIVMIPNTLELSTLWVSAPLASEVEAHPQLELDTPFRAIPFRSDGTLEQEVLFPESVRGRRGGPRDEPRLAPSAKRPRIRAVAFDLDGLMFDTEALFFRVATEMLAARGKVFTQEIMAAMIGRQSPVSWVAFKTMAGLEESIEDLLAEARVRFREVMDTAVHPTPGLFALLSHLGAGAIPAAIATSSRREYAERLLRNHGLMDHFRFLLTADDVTRGKPDPEIYRTAAERFGIEPSALLVLEDSPAGVAAGKGAGAFVVAVPHDHSPPGPLAEADRIVPRLDDPGLLALLEASGTD